MPWGALQHLCAHIVQGVRQGSERGQVPAAVLWIWLHHRLSSVGQVHSNVRCLGSSPVLLPIQPHRQICTHEPATRPPSQSTEGRCTRVKAEHVEQPVPLGLWHVGEPQKKCRMLPDARDWQALDAVKLPDDCVLELYSHKGLCRPARLAEGRRIAPDRDHGSAISADSHSAGGGHHT